MPGGESLCGGKKPDKLRYRFLSEKESAVYRQIDRGVERAETEIEPGLCSAEELSRVIRSVLTDNPQYFWFEGRVSAGVENGRVIVRPHYLYGVSEIGPMMKELEDALQSFGAYRGAGDYEKARAAYDRLICGTVYTPSVSGQNAYNALVERKAVCKGLSKAYQLILAELGLFSTLSYGTLDGTAIHIWNTVEIGGKYYNVDVSLGYPLFDRLFDGSERNDRYRTFLRSDDYFSRTHRLTENVPRLICNTDYGRSEL